MIFYGNYLIGKLESWKGGKVEREDFEKDGAKNARKLKKRGLAG